MNNTIDSSNLIKTVVSDTKQTLNNKAEADNPSQNASLSPKNLVDTVSITDAAKQLASTEKLNSNMPINDSSKIDAIKQEIANGTYQIDSQAIADKLIEFE